MAISVENSDGVLTITIDNPARRNTLTTEDLNALTTAFNTAQADTSVRVVTLLGRADVFTAGADMQAFLKAPSAQADTPQGVMLNAMAACTKPIVALVEGPCVGLGVVMLYYCDLVYASQKALFSAPFTALGLCPCHGLTRLALDSARYPKVAEKLLLSEPLNAYEAMEMGILTDLLDPEHAREQVAMRVARLSEMAPEAIQATKALLKAAQGDIEAVAKREAQTFAQLAQTANSREACQAFLEGRKPNLR